MARKRGFFCQVCGKGYLHQSSVEIGCTLECESILKKRKIEKETRKLEQKKNPRMMRRKKKRLFEYRAQIKALKAEIQLLKTGKVPEKNGFYFSDEWRKLRYQVIKANGRKCQACGTSSKEIHVDHIKPRSKFPELSLEFSNLQVLCIDCNFGKSNTDQTDWRQN